MDTDRQIDSAVRAIRFAARLREALVARGQSQKWLASETGLSESFISRLLAGERTPSLTVLDTIAAALWIDAGRLWRTGA